LAALPIERMQTAKALDPAAVNDVKRRRDRLDRAQAKRLGGRLVTATSLRDKALRLVRIRARR
jgi:hypothetical protein